MSMQVFAIILSAFAAGTNFMIAAISEDWKLAFHILVAFIMISFSVANGVAISQ